MSDVMLMFFCVYAIMKVLALMNLFLVNITETTFYNVAPVWFLSLMIYLILSKVAENIYNKNEFQNFRMNISFVLLESR